jgi:hypothetical protein
MLNEAGLFFADFNSFGHISPFDPPNQLSVINNQLLPTSLQVNNY